MGAVLVPYILGGKRWALIGDRHLLASLLSSRLYLSGHIVASENTDYLMDTERGIPKEPFITSL